MPFSLKINDIRILLENCCRHSSQIVYDCLRVSPKQMIRYLIEGVTPPTTFWFLLPLGSGGPITHLRVSIPPGASGNRVPSHGESWAPKTIETALIGPDGDLLSIHTLGYDGVRLFSGQESYKDTVYYLEAEILRLLPYARGEKEIPKGYLETDKD